MLPTRFRSYSLSHPGLYPRLAILVLLIGLAPFAVEASASTVISDQNQTIPAQSGHSEWQPHSVSVFPLSNKSKVPAHSHSKKEAKSVVSAVPGAQRDSHLAAVDQFAIAATAWSKDKEKTREESQKEGRSTVISILDGSVAPTEKVLSAPSGRVRIPNGTSLMAPPSTSPGLLPPIPSALLGSLPSNPIMEPSSGRSASRSFPRGASSQSNAGLSIDNGDQTPGGTASLGPILPYSSGRLESMLSIESQRMNLAAAPNMAVSFVVDGTQQSQRLVAASHIYVGTPRAPVSGPYDYGLSTLFLPDSAPLGGRGASCMIVLHLDDGARLWSRFIAPLAQVSHPESGAAFLIGHAMGHCLDAQSRMGLDARMTWDQTQSATLKTLGIWPDAAFAAYGKTMNKDAYWANPALLNNNPAQQQFAERGADALGAAWMFKLGADAKALEPLLASADILAIGQAHATGPVWPILKTKVDAFRSAQRLPDLWDMAQLVRDEAGVSASSQEVADNGAAPDQSGSVRHWKVTAAGLIPVDDNGNLIPGAQPAGAPVDFNHLDQFGGGTFGGGTFGGNTFGTGH